MGKVSEVEISGHNYRYEYVDGKTLYRGPVGDAPAMAEGDWLKAIIELNEKSLLLTEITENNVHFESGVSVRFPFICNTEKSPYLGERFDQHIEPTGRYLLHDTTGRKPSETWEQGIVEFKSPLVIEHIATHGPGGWKQRLSEFYNTKGKKLTRKLIDDGYDGIITVEEYKGNLSTSEIVQLKR